MKICCKMLFVTAMDCCQLVMSLVGFLVVVWCDLFFQCGLRAVFCWLVSAAGLLVVVFLAGR